jgi:hypothetical protein
MVRAGRFAILLSLLPIVVRAQDDPLAWLALRVGSRWVYEHEWKSGDRNRPNVERWTTEEAITGLVKTPEGLLVLREVNRKSISTGRTITGRLLGLDGQLHGVEQQDRRQSDAYLIQRNCVYAVVDGFDVQNRQLRASYKKYLAEGAVSPDFCFPLEIGRTWGHNDIPWRVEPARNGEGSFLLPEYADAIRIFPITSAAAGGRMSGFRKASEWWANTTPTAARTTSSPKSFCRLRISASLR